MFLGTEFLSRRLWSERVIRLSLMTGVSWLIVQSREQAYRVWSHCMTQADWDEYRMIRHHAQLVYVDAEGDVAERTNHS